MTIYEHQLRHAPGGMNTVIDRPQMPPSRCEFIRGFLPARHGFLEAAHPLYPLPTAQATNGDMILGVAFYAGTPISASGPEASYLIVVRGFLQVYAHRIFPPIYGSANYPFVTDQGGLPLGNLPYGGDGYASQHIRSVQYQGELFIVQDGGGAQVQRITMDGGMLKMYPCGIWRPGIGTVAGVGTGGFALSDGGAGAMAAGTYSYRLTWADEKFRESSPSASISIMQAINKKVTQTVTWPGDQQVKYAYLYRAAQGTSDYYRITPDGGSIDYIQRGTTATTAAGDNTTEANLVVGALAPRAGQNDVPNKASMVAIHKNRLVLNDASILSTPTDRESVDTIQISNSNAPTQFSTTGTADYPSDGASFVVGSDRGDFVTGIHSYGSLLQVFKRQSRFLLYGEDLATWEIRFAEARGCVAGDTIVEAAGTLVYMAIDGLYQVVGDNASTKLTDEVDSYFSGFASKSPL